MITVTIGNSVSKIEGLTREQHAQLKYLMSYELDPAMVFFSKRHGSSRRSLLGARGDFPTGLFYIVDCFLVDGKIEYVYADKRQKPSKFIQNLKMKMDFSPYPEQLLSAQIAAEATRGIICAPTGIGKTAIAALIVKELRVRTLLVVPTLNIKEQALRSFKGMFGEEMVGSLEDSKNIAIENVDSLDLSKPLINYDCVIIDEFHHSGAKTYRQLNKKAWTNVYYKFGLTATPFRSKDSEKLLLESVLSEVIYEIDYKTAVLKGYIVPMKAYYWELPKVDIQGNERSWPIMYNELVVNNKHRNEIVATLMRTAPETPKLCLVKEIQHGKILEKLTSIPFIHGEHENGREMLLEFLTGESNELIGTTGVLGEGVDTKPAEIIIIAGLGKSKNAFMQQVGRGFRNYDGKTECRIILFLDRSHKWTLAHFKAQVKYLKEEYGVVPIKLN